MVAGEGAHSFRQVKHHKVIEMNRKEFIAALGRVSILSILTVLVGIFVFRDKITVQSECTVNKYCKRCDQLQNCTLPEALKEKNHGKG